MSFIQFHSDNNIKVLRLSKDGVWANPDIPADEAAKLVLVALDINIKALIDKAVKAERDRFALECIDLVAFYGGPVELEASIRARGTHET